MRGERPFIYHTPNGREMFQALQKILPALRTGAVNRSVGDAVLQWSAAEQMPLGYAVPSARRCRAARPPLGGGLSAQPTGGREKPYDSSPSVSASRCHLPRRGRQGENGLPRRFAPRNDSASRCRGRRPAKKGSTLAGASFTYTQCFSRLSQRLLSHVPRLWNSCTSRIRMTTATSITRYLYR